MHLRDCILAGCSLYMVSCYFFKQKTAYEVRISDGSSDVCSSDLAPSWPSRNCRKGLAMIKDKDLWNVEGLETRFTSSPMPLTEAIAVIGGRKGFRINRVRTCHCCGEIAWDNGRCTKHQDRNPFVVEGCKRTRKAHGQIGRAHV